MSCNCGSKECNTCCVNEILNNPVYTNPCDQICEDHNNNVIVSQYTACVKVQNKWAVPNASNLVTLKIPALIDILVGSYLWNPDYGYFEIVSFDANGNMVRVRRVGDPDDTFYTVAAGTTVLPCTKFIITDNLSDFAEALVNLDLRLTVAETNIDVIEGNITSIQNDITTIEGDITTIENDLNIAEADIVDIQADISTLQSDISTLQSDISTLQSDVSTLQSDVSDLQLRVTVLELIEASKWKPVSEAWTFLSSNTVTVPSGAVSRYVVGQKIRLTNSTVKYFYIQKVANTVLTLAGGSDYVLTNTTISSISISDDPNPFDFPPYHNFNVGLVITPSSNSISGVTIPTAIFRMVGNVVIGELTFTGTLTGVANSLRFNLPVITLSSAFLTQYFLSYSRSAALTPVLGTLHVGVNGGLSGDIFYTGGAQWPGAAVEVRTAFSYIAFSS